MPTTGRCAPIPPSTQSSSSRPGFLHCEIACAAAAAGKHVFLEKPMALSLEECTAIESACRDAGVKLQIGFMRRFDEGFLRAKAVLDSGDLGRVMIIKSTGRGPGGPGPWMWDLKQRNGIIAEVSPAKTDRGMFLARNSWPMHTESYGGTIHLRSTQAESRV